MSSEYPARAVVDLDAIRRNVGALVERAPTAQVLAVVKGDAYGHGLVPCARAALAGGATWLGIAQVTEALALRAAGIQAPLLAWLYAPGAPLRAAVEADIDLSVSAEWALTEVLTAARQAGRTARLHLKVDTGLGRGGAMPSDFEKVLDAALRAEAEGLCAVVGLWSHLARADEPGDPSVAAQVEVFRSAIATAEAHGARLEVRHLANSAGTLTAPETHFDLVRPGLAVFGLTPVPQLGGPERYGLTPAMTLEARLALVKDVPAGYGVSYGHRYVTPRDTRLGLVPIGYADGVPRHGSEVAPVQVGGNRHVIAGRVCMDQFVIDLGDTPAAAGDRVVLFGTGADGGPTAQDWAEAVGTISYEVVTRVGPRIPRVYVGGTAAEDGAGVADRTVAEDAVGGAGALGGRSADGAVL